MRITFRIIIARFLILTFFLFLLPADSFTKTVDEKKGLELIEQGEKLLREYKYRESINSFIEAEKLVKNEKELVRMYLGLSRSYYAMGLMTQVRESINKFASLRVNVSIKESEFPRGYLEIYNDVLKDSEQKQGAAARVIEKQGIKKKRKKSIILPLILGAAVLGGLAALLTGKLGSGSTDGNTISVHIESNPSGAGVFVDGASKGVTTPCEIKVSEGTREIKLSIERWGETTTNRDFSKNNSYSLNAELAPYKYESTYDFSISSAVYYGDWDIDSEGNIYGVDHDYVNSCYKLFKYDRSGNEILKKALNTPGNAHGAIAVMFNKVNGNLYVYCQLHKLVYIYDANGDFISKQSGMTDSVNCYDNDIDGNIYYINEDHNKLGVLNGSTFLIMRELITSSTYSLYGVDCSTLNRHIYVIEGNKDEIIKYDENANRIVGWAAHPDGGFTVGREISSGSLNGMEKVFVESTDEYGTFRIEVYDSDGNYLTRTEDTGNSIWRIEADDSWSLFIESPRNKIHILEPSSETEGVGVWDAVSVVSNRSGIGSASQNKINLPRNRKAGKSDIEKKKDKNRSK